MRQYPSLARQNTIWLALAFILVELLVIGLFVFWVLLPLVRRSTDDLAGLMVLSAQTWAELPPSARPAFEVELLNSHRLALRLDLPIAAHSEWHAPYFYWLEDALARRTGAHQHIRRELLETGVWYWAQIPSGDGQLSVGLPASRIGGQPIAAFFMAIGLGLLFALGLAWWLARRLTQPLARLEAASVLIGQGGSPVRLPESGSREMVTLSRRFNAMAQQVQDLLRSRTTLLAGISHDLRTPLARMRLALEILKDRHDIQLIERLERDIEQMNRLIGTALDLARGLAREEPSPTDVGDFLNKVGAEFSTSVSSVRVACPAIRCNLARLSLQRAVENLLQNAQRYAPGLPVDLIGRFEGGACHIGVLDRGPGIAPDQLEAVFQPFYRIDSSRSPSTGGFGLGLAIVQELARANGWRLSLQQRVGGGLQVWIELPNCAV